MDRPRLVSLAERWAPLLATLAIVWPLAAYRYAASHDLPFHEEIVAAMRYHADPTRYPPDFFVWRVGMPNQLFYFLAYPLAFVVSPHVACTIVLGASVAGIVFGSAHLARYLGRTRWVAVAVAPIAIGFLFNCGFVGNVLGLGLFLWLLPVLDRFAARPTARGAAVTVLALLFLDFAHESIMTIGALAIVVLSAGRRLGVRETALRVFPPAVALGAFFAVHAFGNATGGPKSGVCRTSSTRRRCKRTTSSRAWCSASTTRRAWDPRRSPSSRRSCCSGSTPGAHATAAGCPGRVGGLDSSRSDSHCWLRR